MECWSEISDDIQTFINWWKICDRKDAIAISPNLKLFGVFGEMILWPQERDEYLEISRDAVKEIFANDMKDYWFYWYVEVPFKTYQPKISQYKKVWKVIEPHYNLDGFTFGPEIEAVIHNDKYFISIARFNQESFPMPEQFESMLCEGVLIASQTQNLLSEEFLREFSWWSHFNTIYRFDYVSIIKERCLLGDIIFLYENNIENRTVCLAFEEEKVEVFNEYVKKYR